MANKTIAQLPSKANPTDSDLLVIADAADSNEMKQITIGSITADIGDGLIVDGSSSLTTTYSSTKIAADNATQDAAKLNTNAQLRTGNGAWKVSHTNGSGNEVELALGTAGQVLTSSGATSAPTFATPTTDIVSLTEDTTGSMANDFLLAYDTSAGANRKQKPQVYSATDAEIDAGTSTTKWATANQNSKYSINTMLRNDYFTYQVPILLNGTDSVLPGWTSTTVEATAAGGAAGFVQLSGSGVSTFVISDLLPGHGAMGSSAMYWNPGANKETRLKFRMGFNTTTNRKGFGICAAAATIYTAQTDITNGTIRFIINGTSIYAHNSNGTTATTTDISSGITITTWNVYEIVYYSTTLCEFYINGVLKATHTTNLPTTTAAAHYLAIGNDTGNNSFMLCPPVISMKI